jgi:hypothetical protein
MSQKPTPTIEQYSAYQGAWEWFNQELFGGKLKPCKLTFSRHRGSVGFFTPRRWKKGDQEIHEIALNPAGLSRPLEEVMSTLVHEMVHQWQFDYGTPPRKAYHDQEWADKMKEIGLIPSDTGKPGGRRTGQRMSHYIDPEGKFIKALRRMPRKYVLPWLSEEHEKPPAPKTPKKLKLTCPGCEGVCWVTDGQSPEEVDCGDCGEQMLTKEELRERKEDERG